MDLRKKIGPNWEIKKDKDEEFKLGLKDSQKENKKKDSSKNLGGGSGKLNN